MFPASRAKVPMRGVLDNSGLSESVKGAYRSAVNVVNVGEWNAGAVLCRRLLEGISKSVLPQDCQQLPLAKQLLELPKHRDLTRPLIDLADAVRKGGNIGAHFDLEREPDQRIAELMLELCEDLMQYLFVLPGRIAELHGKIETLGTPTVAPEAE